MEYTFTLKYQLSERDSDHNDLVERLGAMGCDDAVGVTRQNMRKLMINHATSFPTPVHEGSASVWHLAEVITWLQTRGKYETDALLLEVALTTMQVNAVKEIRIRPLKDRVRKALQTILA
ncbi:DNA-binding protein [Bordetella ansorpii]|uniref:DNA-binding protein n=1 Tax=Bordetella ansorpii TaxID=288768 RepID=A0A157SWY8_9BORD|nr:hypothetical protein [Bordetella ansorpii]SAI74851.1 DNA-binding protein [Bordetella ansorpii]